MIVSTVSMEAGHSSTHAMHVVHAQSSWVRIGSPWIGPGSSPGRWRLSFTMTCWGGSAVPASHAGHAAWQRPHSTHASKSSRRFHENSASVETPKLSASSMLAIGAIAPRGPSFAKKMLSGVVIRGTKYEYGMTATNASETAAGKRHTARWGAREAVS